MSHFSMLGEKSEINNIFAYYITSPRGTLLMQDSIIKDLLKKEKIVDWVAAICGICVSIIAWVVPNTATVPFYVLAIVIVCSILIISKLLLYSLLCKNEINTLKDAAESQDTNIMPRLIKVVKSPRDDIILVTKTAIFFRHRMIVSIIYDDNEVEQKIAEGVILNIQQNNLMQTSIVSIVEGYEELVNKMMTFPSIYKNSIRIFPGQ